MNELLNSLQAKTPEHPELAPGDTVKVHVRIVEGDRERIQIFQGVVIRLRGGGNNLNFTVRRIASNSIGVERTFLFHSPRILSIFILRAVPKYGARNSTIFAICAVRLPV